MNLARNLERRLERLIEGLASKLFPGTVSAPELAQRLIREADLSVVEGPAGPVVPNVYGVRMHPDDLGPDAAPSDLTAELAHLISSHACEQGWRLEGGVHVQVVADPSLTAGAIDIAATVIEGSLDQWAFLSIKPSGDQLPIAPNRVLIGRDVDNDVILPAEEVSRHHATVWREGADVWLADLGSSNGTTINGRTVTAPAVLANGDTVVFGPTETIFRLV